jgi:hypothetical protein
MSVIDVFNPEGPGCCVAAGMPVGSMGTAAACRQRRVSGR